MQFQFPYIDSFGKNNCIKLVLEGLNIWFSYGTIIAFQFENEQIFISENIWSNTTGKHLNQINSDKRIRISRKEFEDIFDKKYRRYVGKFYKFVKLEKKR